MLGATPHPSSPRKRGPIRRVLSLWHNHWKLRTAVVMGPRFRGDDAEFVTRSHLFLVALIGWVALLPVSTAALAAEKLRVGKAVAEAFSFVPPDVGVRSGIFAKNNIELELIAFAGDARMQQAAAADSIDILLGSGPAMAFIAKGAPIKGIAAMAGPPLLLAIVVRPDGPKTPADLRGTTV